MVIGLGNIGKEYERNRHNAGFIMVDKYAEELGLAWKNEKKFNANVARGSDVILVKPLTLMNRSGSAVSSAVSFYKVEPADVYVIHDDVDLEFGKVKVQRGGGSAGHHGIEDVIEKLGTQEFWRVRIGVGRPIDTRFEVTDWVLSDFSDEELHTVVTEVDIASLLEK